MNTTIDPNAPITITITPDVETRPTFITGRWVAGGEDVTDRLGRIPPAWDARGPMPAGLTAAGLARLRDRILAAPEGSELRALGLDGMVPNTGLSVAMCFRVYPNGTARGPSSDYRYDLVLLAA